MGRKSLIFDSAWQDLHRRRARHRRIPAAVRSCSALRYGLLANFFFSPRNAPVFPGTTGLPAWTTPWAPFGRLQEPPPQKAETARTAGSCGRAGGTTTPALSPARRRRKLHISRFRPKGRKLARSAAPPLPTGPASLGSGGSPGVSSAEPRNRPCSARRSPDGAGIHSTGRYGTQPLTAHHRSRSVPAVPGVSAHAVARCSAPCSPASDGSAGGPRPAAAAE